MSITKDDVRGVANLARLAITDEATETYAVQLSNILDYVDKLSALDTEGVSVWRYKGTEGKLRREDRPTGSLPRERALSNGPDSDGTFFKVPKVIE